MQMELSHEEAVFVLAALMVAKDVFAEKALEQGEESLDWPLQDLIEHADDLGKISKLFDDLSAKFARLVGPKTS